MARIAAVPLVVVLFAACQTTKPPRALPEGYLPTPFGLVHRTCVRHLPEGHRISADLVVTKPNGERETLPPCRHRRLHSRTYEPIPASSDPSGSVFGWVTGAMAANPTPIGSLQAEFNVPSAPSSPNANATIFFFPGITSATPRILQPVLQYGPSAGGGGTYWSAASWFAAADWGIHSTLMNVNAGDLISGTITSTCSSGSCDWTIVTQDMTLGTSTTLPVTGTTAPFDTYQGAVLEAYLITACDQLPASSPLLFMNIAAADQQGNPIEPGWVPFVFPQTLPCGYGANTTPTTVTLAY